METKIPRIKIEIKDASSLKDGLIDINGKPLPKEGIVIKRVSHNSFPAKTDYIIPEGGDYFNYLSSKLSDTDMSDFLKKAKTKM